jgi:hypothetical protein
MKTKIILPKKDQDFLEELGLPFRIEKEGYLDKIFVIISQVEINSKYYSAANKSAVDVCIIIPPGYPNSQIDMTHFFPGLVRTDKRPIPILTMEEDYVMWQTLNGKHGRVTELVEIFGTRGKIVLQPT